MPDTDPKRAKNREACQTILSDEFRVELQPSEDGPTLTVSGHAHDPELVLVVRGHGDVDDDEPIEVEEARIVVTVEHLAELVECIRKVQADR